MKCAAFELNTDRKCYDIWGNNGNETRFYFDEMLPAFYRRTLHFEQLSLGDGCLSWIFTGPKARVQLNIKKDSLELLQVYTDSFALQDEISHFTQDGKRLRHIERKRMSDTAVYDEALRTVTVVLDHHMDVTVLLNDRPLLRQNCTIDTTQHQLILNGEHCLACGYLSCPDIKAASLTIDTAQKRQTMLGFGGIASPVSYGILSEEGKEKWWQLIREYNLLIQREYPSNHESAPGKIDWDDPRKAVPHNYGHNFPIGEFSDFAYNRRIQEMGGDIWFEFWKYPAFTLQDDIADPQALVDTMLDYCVTAREKTGKAPAVVGVQNERCQPAPILAQIVSKLCRALDEAGMTETKIHMCNAPNLRTGFEYLDKFQADPKAWELIDYAASNLYDYQSSYKDTDRYDEKMLRFKERTADKPFLSTEIAVNHIELQEDSYRMAFMCADLYHKNLTLLDACAICYCFTLLHTPERSYCFTRSLFTVDDSNGFLPVPSGFRLRTFGAFSRHILAGMIRVEVRCDTPDLLCSGYLDEQRNGCVVIINRSTVEYEIDLSSVAALLPDCRAERTDYYTPNREIHVSGTCRLQPGAILTVFRNQ